MSHSVIEMNCPGCGAPVFVSDKTCKYCHRPVVISTFNNVCDMPIQEVNKYVDVYTNVLREVPNSQAINFSIAMCYLKLKLYDKAIRAFDKAVVSDLNNSEIYFYSAISLLKGKKAFLQQRATIDQIQEYINAAITIEPKGIYYYFWAYIKYDYFKRKCFATSPDYAELFDRAKCLGISEFDVCQLYSILGVIRPECL